MAEVRHSALTWRLFDLGLAAFRSGWLLPTRFGGAWPAVSRGRPVVLVANHVSWWDGFLLREVQKRLRPTAPFHTVVVADQLEQHPMLRRLGGVPVEPARPSSVLRMLRTLGRLRQVEAETVFGYFPQGRIWPTSRRPLALRRGVEAVGRMLAPVDVVPVSIHLEPMVDVRPTPFLWLGEPFRATHRDDTIFSDAVEERLADGLDQIRMRLDRWGEDTRNLWPDAVEAPAHTPNDVHDGGPIGSPSPLTEPSCVS